MAEIMTRFGMMDEAALQKTETRSEDADGFYHVTTWRRWSDGEIAKQGSHVTLKKGIDIGALAGLSPVANGA